jgi:LAO/AO transport system kinase
VLTCSALDGSGIDEVWAALGDYHAALEPTGEIARRRATQAGAWMWHELREGLLADFTGQAGIAEAIAALEARVVAGATTPHAAARELLALARGETGETT